MERTTPLGLPRSAFPLCPNAHHPAAGWAPALAAVACIVLAHGALADVWDGDWLETNALPRSEASAIYDPIRHRFLLFGGTGTQTARNDVWAYELDGTPQWARLSPTGSPPPPISGAAAVYDPVGDRMIVCGGREDLIGACPAEFNQSAWALSLSGQPTWTMLASGGPGRAGITAVYDSRRSRVIVYGGLWQGCLLPVETNDVWSLTLGASPSWKQLSPAYPIGMPPPPERARHVAIYDPVADRMVVFGGFNSDYPGYNVLGDTWSLALDTTLAWTRVVPAGTPPSPRANMVGVFDSNRERMVIFGGYGLADTWALNLQGNTSWELIPTSGPVPSPTTEGAAAYDAARDQLIYQCKLQTSALGMGSQAWKTLDLVPPLPAPRVGFSSVFDPVRRRWIVFGGYDGNTLRNDVWALGLDPPRTWQPLMPTGGPPSARRYAAAIYDPQGDRMILFGGNGHLSDTWALHLSPTPTWELLQPSGTTPYGRERASAVYDPVHASMILFGGFDGYVTMLNDVRSLSLVGPPVWTEIHPAGTLPAGHDDHTAVYDPVGPRMLIFGGVEDGTGVTNETWALSLGDASAWSLLAPDGSPPSVRLRSAGFYDSQGHRMIVRGGVPYASSNRPYADIWALTLDPVLRWDQLDPSGSGPSERSDGAAGYDPLTNRAIFFGGLDRKGMRSDTWLLDLQNVPTPALATLVSAYSNGAMVRLEWYSPEPGIPVTIYRRTQSAAWQRLADKTIGGDGLLIYEDRDVEPGERYGYRLAQWDQGTEIFTTETWVDVSLPSGLALGLAPNPTNSSLQVTLALGSSTDARLEILDLKGRIVLRKDLSSVGPGQHVLNLSTGFIPSAGVYIARVCQGTQSVRRKFVVVGTQAQTHATSVR